jgi:hypothetical protein
MKIIAHGHYSKPVDDVLPPLKELVKETTGESVRRVGRFIQLALIGAGRCLQSSGMQHSLPADTAIYLTSGRGDLEVTIEVLEQMLEHGLSPKPLSFINTVSNSACFYLAKHFGLHGRSHFVTRRHAPLECVLQLASLDIETGAVKTALVGSVDICTLPIEDHRKRVDVSDNTAVGEGSHWFLLAHNNYSGNVLAVIDAVLSLPDNEALQQWLATQSIDDTVITYGQHIDQASHLPWYDSHSGHTLGQFLALRPARRLLHIDSDPDGRFNVLQVSLL